MMMLRLLLPLFFFLEGKSIRLVFAWTPTTPLKTKSSATLSVVLPSPGNPKSKLNQRVVNDLKQQQQQADPLVISNVERVSSGRVQFDWNHHQKRQHEKDTTDTTDPTTKHFASWLGQRGIRSLRILISEGELKTAELLSSSSSSSHQDDKDFICGVITKNILGGVHSNLSSTLRVWELFGNTLPNSDDDPSVYVSCQKLQVQHPHTSSFYDSMSTTRLASQIALNCHEEFQWRLQPKKQKANLRLHVVLSMIEEDEQSQSQRRLQYRVELVTLKIPSTQRANQELPHGGMKRVEAWAVAKSANIQPNHTVLDPMCGKGTFLIEAATFWPKASKFIGIDNDPNQLQLATINAQATSLQNRIQFIEGDATNLTTTKIPSNSIDRILCCPPFGRQFLRQEYQQQHGSFFKSLYQDLLREWDRILIKKEGGRMVLVIDQNNLQDLLKAIQQETNCVVQCLRRFRLGRLQAYIIVADRHPTSPNGKQKSTTTTTTIGSNPADILPWEKEYQQQSQGPSGNKKKNSRALWTQLRASELPSLVPVSKG